MLGKSRGRCCLFCRLLVAVFVLSSLANRPARANSIVNGDFEQDLSIGWTVTGTSFLATVDREYDAGLGSTIVHLHRDQLLDVPTISQTVALPGSVTDYSFSIDAKLQGSYDWLYGAGAAQVRLSYLDSGGGPIAYTSILSSTPNLGDSWDTHHLIYADDEDWNFYSLPLGQEFSTYLTGADAASVTAVDVTLRLLGFQTWGALLTTADLQADNVQLGPGEPPPDEPWKLHVDLDGLSLDAFQPTDPLTLSLEELKGAIVERVESDFAGLNVVVTTAKPPASEEKVEIVTVVSWEDATRTFLGLKERPSAFVENPMFTGGQQKDPFNQISGSTSRVYYDQVADWMNAQGTYTDEELANVLANLVSYGAGADFGLSWGLAEDHSVMHSGFAGALTPQEPLSIGEAIAQLRSDLQDSNFSLVDREPLNQPQYRWEADPELLADQSFSQSSTDLLALATHPSYDPDPRRPTTVPAAIYQAGVQAHRSRMPDVWEAALFDIFTLVKQQKTFFQTMQWWEDPVGAVSILFGDPLIALEESAEGAMFGWHVRFSELVNALYFSHALLASALPASAATGSLDVFFEGTDTDRWYLFSRNFADADWHALAGGDFAWWTGWDIAGIDLRPLRGLEGDLWFSLTGDPQDSIHVAGLTDLFLVESEPVPEPSTVLLLGLAVAGLTLKLRHRLLHG